ncbi:MAG: DUF1572 family protein [Pyrinomonadaceae bacterium]
MKTIAENYLLDALRTFESYKKLAERAIDQIDEKEFFVVADSESNSAAVLVKHISGNLRSRFTDFFTTDGEKPDRNRDREFELESETREGLMADWDKNWTILFSLLEKMKAEDLSRTVTIRSQPHTVLEALNRQMAHYSYHVGQIVFISKMLRSGSWKSLSVPKNQSAGFNDFMSETGHKSGKHALEGTEEFVSKGEKL